MKEKITQEEVKEWMSAHKVLLGLIIVGAVFIGVLIGMADDTPQATTSTKFLSIGDEGKLDTPGRNVAHYCISHDWFMKLVDASVANDDYGYRQLILSDYCFMASTIDSYGEVLVIGKKGLGATQFRFTNPDSIGYGKTGWTWSERIIRR